MEASLEASAPLGRRARDPRRAGRGRSASYGGFRVKFNLADLVLPPTHPTEVAAFATVPLNDVLAFQPEVLSNLQDAESSAKTKFGHYQVPLLGRFRFAKGSPVAFLAGPSVGFWTRVDEFAGNFEIHVKGFEFGYVGGVEMEALSAGWRF